MDYSSENWKALGAWIKRKRLNAGFADVAEWADAVKRSTRQMQGLERGEPVGPKTLQSVANVLLGGDPADLYELLDPEAEANLEVRASITADGVVTEGGDVTIYAPPGVISLDGVDPEDAKAVTDLVESLRRKGQSAARQQRALQDAEDEASQDSP